MKRDGTAPALLTLLALAGCIGDGSDLGPSVEPLPEARFEVLVKDADGDGVCNAFVSIDGVTPAPLPTRRSGRVDLFVSPNGRHRVVVDAGTAAASSGDDLASLAFAADLGGFELPFVVYLPDLSQSAVALIVAGPQPGGVVLDDTATSGARIEIQPGTVASFEGGIGASLRTGALPEDRMPPIAMRGAAGVLATRGAFVGPVPLTLSKGATLSLPNDIGLAPGGTARLLRLDPATGEWTDVGGGTADGAGDRIVSDDGAFTRDGLHCFVRDADTVATVMATVLQDERDVPQRDVLVRVGQSTAVTDQNGRFVLDDIAVAGASRDVTLTLSGGAELLPIAEDRSLRVWPGQVIDLGEITIDNDFANEFRLLLVARGARDAFGDVGIGSVDGTSGASGVADADGRFDAPAIEEGYVGFLRTQLDPTNIDVLDIDGLQLWVGPWRSIDLRLFYDPRPWVSGNAESVACWVVDERFGSPIEDAYVHRFQNGIEAFLGRTIDSRIERFGFGNNTEATLSIDSTVEGRRVVAAYTARDIRNARGEYPLPRPHRAPAGAFEPFAWASGDVPGSGDKTVAVTGRLLPEQWVDAVFEARPLEADTPVDTLPQVAGGDAFRIGVPVGGNIAGTAGSNAAGARGVDSFTWLDGLALDRSTTTVLSLGESIPFDVDYTVPGGFTGRDARIPLEAFRASLALVLPDGRAVDVARDVAANVTAAGDDAVLRLPARTGRLADARLLVALTSSAADGATTLEQRSLVELDTTQPPSVPLLPLPQVFAPAPGAQVSAGGFDVEFQLPSDALYGFVRLVDDDGTTLREWRALLPGDSTAFRFRTLPQGPAVLAPGTYTLEVSAARLSADARAFRLGVSPYQAVRCRFYGISRYERELEAESTVRFDVEVVP